MTRSASILYFCAGCTRIMSGQAATRSLMFFSYFLIFILGCTQVWGSEKIKLTDLKTVTLYSGKLTSGRRTAPVPQLECIGGSAGCSAFVPQVVQCYNKGFDGYDVQWECKTDMDNAYRFGKVEVTCEGYDYPNDPYVLKGSCGLRYTIDLTKEGNQQKKGHNYGYGGYSNYNYSKGKSGLLSDVIILVIVVVIIYAIIKTCLHSNQYSTTNDDYPQDDSRYFSGGFQAPPPPGFRTDYMSSPGGCAAPAGSSTSSGGGGFWTGAMTGGLLGYMFGSRSNQGHHSSWGSTYRDDSRYSRPFSGSFNTSDDSSSGTRTASGYGGTSRR